MDTSRSLHDLIVRSTLRARMQDGSSVVVAGWLQSGDWRTARALGAVHEVVVIDAEHGAVDMDQIALCVEVLAANSCLAIVRVPFDDDARKAFARRCLDAGAIGILFPNVQSQEEAARNVRNCYYPCAHGGDGDGDGDGGGGVSGTRGFGFGGCNLDGEKFKSYTRVANDRIVVGVQLENRRAFEDGTLDSILQDTPGLVFTQDGPFDHSGSYLVPGQTSDPRVVADLAKYRAACRATGIVAGKHVVHPTEETIMDSVARDGYRFIALGTDMLHLHNGCARVLAIAEKGAAAAAAAAAEAKGGGGA